MSPMTIGALEAAGIDGMKLCCWRSGGQTRPDAKDAVLSASGGTVGIEPPRPERH